MYVAVKGGEKAIKAAHNLLARRRRGDQQVAEIGLDQITEQLSLSVARVMSEASLYDAELAALAIKQARGDLVEAIFLARAYRTTLARLGDSIPVNTARMRIERRISACFRDMPGGQVLGPTFDYTHRLLGELERAPEIRAQEQTSPSARSQTGAECPPGADRAAASEDRASGDAQGGAAADLLDVPRISDLLGAQALLEPDAGETTEPPEDLTRAPLKFPAGRALRLQSLSRGDEGFLLGLAYSTQRGFGRTHPFVGEVRLGTVEVVFDAPELGFAVPLGRVAVTECDMINQFKGTSAAPPQFTRGYGLVFGQSERKAMSMALVDRALRTREFGEDIVAPAQDEEFVLSHCDNVKATGFVEHLKLPHYVDFQAELHLLRKLRAEWETRRVGAAQDETSQERDAAE